MKGKMKNMAGLRFGLWTVLARVEGTKWACECACGKKSVVWGCNLTAGKSTSCGCDRAAKVGAKATTHGMAGSPMYGIWEGMIQRCHNPKNPRRKNYGGRGISVCPRWRNSFEDFYADMGDRPSAKHSIDRINNDGNYEPSNCRWATSSEQRRNQRSRTLSRVSEEMSCPVTTKQFSSSSAPSLSA